MFWLVVLLILFAGLHLALLVAVQVSIIIAAVVTVSLWLIWRLKWIILGIIGLEEFFGGGGGGGGGGNSGGGDWV